MVLCAGGFVRYAASKGLLGGFLGLPPPSAQANLATVLDGSDDVGGMFPAYTNAVTNVCATGIKPADTSVFIRAHWPASLSPAPTGVEVYANSILARTGWSAVGTASVSGPGNSRIIELPYSILPDGWERAMFFTLGLPFDADGDGLTDQFERVVLQTEPDNPDSDEDGLDDGWEYEHGLDPTSEDSDGDGLSDADEVAWVEVEPDAVPWFSLTPLKTVEASHDLDTGLFACELPFDGRISGERVTVALADVNGVVYFGNASTTNGLSSSNSCDDLAYDTWISSVLVAGYWSDLEMRPSLSSRISFGTAVYDGETYFVVQYENMGTYYGSEANSISFQVSVPASTPDVVRVRYGAVVDARDDYDPVSIGAQGGLDGEGRNSPKLVHAYWEAPQPIASGTTLVYRFGSGGDPLLADTDGDGLFDSEETLLGTNPKLWDTDGDGLPDGWEVDHGLDPFSAEGDDGADGDPDLDGLPNSDECTWRSDPHLSDADGDGLDDGVEVGGITAANVLPWLAFDVATDLTASFPSDGEPFAQWTLPAPVAVPGGVVATATLDLNGMVYFNRVGFSGPLYSRGPHDLRDFIVEENSLVVAPYWSYGLFASLDAPDTTRIRAGTATYSGEEFLLIEYENIYYERSSWEEDALSFQIAIPMNRADRAYVRFSDVRGEDMDGNHAVVGFQGLGARRCASWCAWEHGRVEDGIALQFCFGLGSDPALRDTDGDGFDDDVEAAAHTNPARIDTDSDGIPDKWEIDHGLNANAAADAAADPDGDTLSNLEEYLNDTNPGTAVCGGAAAGFDTDGDGVSDGVEVANGSDPNDASDNGSAPPENAFRELVFNIYGDYAAWEMTIEGLGPVDTRTMRITMGAPDVPQSVLRRLRKGNSYRLSMRWLNCDGHTEPYNWYCWQAKIDDLPYSPSYRGYSTERLERNEVVVGNGWIAENADGLLSDHIHMHDPDENGNGGGNVAKDLTATLYVLEDPKLVADYDRDGKIDATDEAVAAAGSKVFRFWLNDDEDRLATEGKYSDSPRVNVPGAENGWWEFDRRDPDFYNGHVDGICDLLDFAPILADASTVVGNLPQVIRSRLSYRLRQTDGALNAVWSNLGRTAANAFQKADFETGFGETLSLAPQGAETKNVSANGLVLTSAFASRVEGGNGIFLVEGRTASTKPLWLEVMDGRTVVCSNRLALAISPVENMYRLASLRDVAENPAMTVPVSGVPSNQPDGTKDLDVFFLHGFNVNAEDARAWGAEVFKRLWQSGSNARFHMLPWRGDYRWLEAGDATTTFSAFHYQHNVWFAQRTGGALRRYVEAAQPNAERRILMTQSLGNMAGCEALREGLRVSQYYMFDAAVSSEAIDGTLRAESPSDAPYAKYVRPEWQDYPGACWAANWHRLFAGSAGDARSCMKWSDRFRNALTNAVEVFNYYSSGDSVFTEMADIPSLLSDTVHWGLDWFLWVVPYPTVDATFENHCWQKQEVLKGMERIAGTAAGGWGFNVWKEWDSAVNDWQEVIYSPHGAAAALADGSVLSKPVFDVRGAEELMNPNATEDDVFLALAKHVPALSSPVGGNGVFGNNRDFDLNGSQYRNGWGRTHPIHGAAWLHSDMKDMAYFYVYKLYDELVNLKGNLK